MKKLNEDIKKGSFERVYLLYGNEPYLTRQYKNRITEAAVGAGNDLNITRFEGKKTEAADILDACIMLPFLADKRVVIAEETEFFGKRAGKMNEYLEEIPDSTVLIFVEDQVDSRSKLYKAVASAGYAAKLDTPDEETLYKWSLSLMKQSGKRISDRTMRSFLTNTERSMDNISNELEKLFSYMGDRQDITEEDVKAVCSFKLEDKVFDMIDMMLKGQNSRALDLYNAQLKLRDSQRGLLSLFIKQFEQLYQIRDLYDRRKGSQEIADLLRLKKWQVDRRLSAVRSFTAEEIKHFLDDAVTITDDINSGRIEEKAAIDMYVCSLLQRK
ncbi:MAG: DNA polymerase III subunit delta [Lachnospiraceae bacterium]|nr:DNA polymerase III subunit delta [Lachnospiraceae bacterium]